MKFRFYQPFITILILAILCLSVVSCDSTNRKNSKEIAVSHVFPNDNWAFEEEVLEFDFDISDTTKNYSVSLALTYDTAVAILRDIPLSVTLNTPDGMQSVAKSHFNLKRDENMGIRLANSGSIAEASVVIFPERRFKAAGTYHLTVYRRAEKADNYGFKELTAKVKPS